MRPREVSYGLNTSMKKGIIHSNKITKNDKNMQDNYEELEEYVSTNLPKKEANSIFPTPNISLHPLPPDDSKRIYSSKDKPIKFHESAAIVPLAQSDLGQISSVKKHINFVTLMAMFDENEIKSIDIEQLLGIKLEKFDDLNKKLDKIMGYVQDAPGPGKNEAMSEVKDKKNQIENNIKNIESINDNVEKIDKIIYGENETKVIFQPK